MEEQRNRVTLAAVLNVNMPVQKNFHERSGERRSQSRPRLKFLLLGGRRKSPRRQSDREDFIYVDQYHPWLMAAIVLLLILSLLDGFFTLYLIEHGATEKNPIMAYFLNFGVWPFMTAKLLLTCASAVILLIFHNRHSRLLRIQVKTLIPVTAAAFLLVLLYQLLLKYSID